MSNDDTGDFDPSRHTAARLFGHILTKGFQLGSICGIGVVLPIAYLYNSSIPKDSLHKLAVGSAAGGVTLAGVLGISKMVGMDQEGMEDRVYRLHYNESQIRMDRMNTVFGMFGAGKKRLESNIMDGLGSLGLMTGIDPYSVIAGFTMGTAAAVIAHQLTAPTKTDIGKIVHELKT